MGVFIAYILSVLDLIRVKNEIESKITVFLVVQLTINLYTMNSGDSDSRIHLIYIFAINSMAGIRITKKYMLVKDYQ